MNSHTAQISIPVILNAVKSHVCKVIISYIFLKIEETRENIMTGTDY